MSKWSSIANSRAEAQTIYFQRKEINRLKNKIELQKQEIKGLRKHLEQLKVDLQEANDNAEWWHNRFKAVQEQNERLKETNVYCNRTDCIGRIKDSRKYDSVYQEKEDYKSRCKKAIEYNNQIIKDTKDFLK